MIAGMVGFVGWGLYYAGANNLFAFLDGESDKPVQLVKKERAVKPRTLIHKVKDVVPAPVKQYDYTFFETLDNVDLEQYVDLDGKVKVMKKTVNAWVDQVEDVIHEPRVLLASYKEPGGAAEKPGDSYEDIIRKLDEIMKKKPKKSAPPPEPVTPAVPSKPAVTSPPVPIAPSAASTAMKRQPFLVQVSSFRKLTQARKLESDLRKKGYSSFVMSVQVSPSKGLWYRVFLGDYATESNARAAAKKAERLHKLKTIVLRASR